jgi:hypothetical protein
LKRLNTDRALSAFAGQFVPLKLITDGNPGWNKWASTYQAEGRGIPLLYVVRADGEQLYAKSGSLPGDALPQMLLTTLKQSGRTFSDAETELLQTSLDEAKATLAKQDHMATAAALGRLKRLGTPGELKSFSALALEADKLAQEVAEVGKKNIGSALAQLDAPDTALDGVLTLVESQKAYSSFPELNAQIVASLREAKRNDALEPLIKQAESLIRARKYAESETASTQRKAVSAYEQVITQFPNTPGAKIAREELAAIDPDAKALSAEITADVFRTWTDATGEFKIEAKVVQQKQGFVQLQKRDGELVSLSIEKLSPADQDFLTNQ